MLALINRKGIMGEMRNRGWQNIVAGSTSVLMIVLTAMMVWTSIWG
jgi:Mn2+/Fe2+ NRAMP family transporter